MDIERRQREAGLPPLGKPEPLPSDLTEGRFDDPERVVKRAKGSANRSKERRARQKSAGRARTALVVGSILAMVGLGAGMWLSADSGTAQTAPTADPVAPELASPSTGGVEVPQSPNVAPAPADAAPQVSSGAS